MEYNIRCTTLPVRILLNGMAEGYLEGFMVPEGSRPEDEVIHQWAFIVC